MKKTKTFFLISVIISVLVFCLIPVKASAGEGVFDNPDFSQWQGEYPDEWNFYASDYDKVYISQTSEGFLLETYNSCAYLYQTVELQPQTCYRISYSVMLEDMDDSGGGAQASFMDQIACSDMLISSDGDYYEDHFYVRTNVDSYQKYVFRIGLGAEDYFCTGSGYFKNLLIEVMDEIPADDVVYTLIGSLGESENYDDYDFSDYETEKEETVDITYNHLGIALSCSLVTLFLLSMFNGRLSEKLGGILKNRVFTVIVFACAFLIRIYFAVTQQPHVSDFNCFKAWAVDTVEYGDGFYTSGIFADYPPSYMYVLYVIGVIRNIFALDYYSVVFELLVKLPPILADLGIAWFLIKKCDKYFNRETGTVLSLFVLFSPVMLLDSAVWGQIDSVLILFIILSLDLFDRGRKTCAAALYTFTFLIKPQAGLIAPVIIALYIRDIVNKETRKKGILDLLTSAFAVVIVFLALSLPFKGEQGIFYVAEKIMSTVGEYPYGSINAFNLIALYGGIWVPDDTQFLIVDYRTTGTIFIILVVIFSVYLVLKEKDRKGLWLGSAFIYLGIFMLGHGMHERYVLPSVVLFLMAAVRYDSRKFVSVSALLQSVSFINVYYVLIYRGTWIPEEIVKPFSLIYLTAFIFMLFITIDHIGKKRVKDRTLLINAVSEPEASEILDSSEVAGEEKRITRKDAILIALITCVYAFFAYFRLGSLDIPERTAPISEGQSYIIEFENEGYIKELGYYAGYSEGDFLVYGSVDGIEYTSLRETGIVNHDYGKMFTWRFIDVYEPVRFIKLYVSHGDLELREIVAWPYEEQDHVIKAVSAYLADEEGNLTDAGYIIDEQDEALYVTDPRYEMYFDEIYHARTAYEYLENIYPYEITHPPLGKSIITLGIRMFGMNPFGWRFMGALFGVFMLPLMYIFIKRIFRRTKWALTGTVLMASGFMHYSLTRISTIDSYSIFFILLMSYFMYEYLNTNYLKDDLKKVLLPLGACGIAWGLGCATKWLCAYAGAGLAIAFFYTVYLRYRESRRIENAGNPHIRKLFIKRTTVMILFCIGFFIIIPLVIYCVSYIPYFNSSEDFGIKGIIENQLYIFNYHSNSVDEATHAFNSKIWTWPFDIRPVFFFMADHLADSSFTYTISCFGNPAVLWYGLAALMILLGIKKDKKADVRWIGYICLMGASQFLPWAIIKREVFIYHYFATIPFLIILILYSLRYIEYNHKWGRNFTRCLIVISVLLFLLFLPMTNGIMVPKWYSDLFRWFDTWPFYNV
ncbi:MAG: glycosyltransferase family 39 protein [Christensenellaceae bacterium]|nr:glycosyltransferase family 39 protein [Christensenellaceae bacterium]